MWALREKEVGVCREAGAKERQGGSKGNMDREPISLQSHGNRQLYVPNIDGSTHYANSQPGPWPFGPKDFHAPKRSQRVE